MQSFKTLLQREWMQHKFGWLVVMLAPMAIALVVLGIGDIQFDVDGSEAGTRLAEVPAVGLALAAIVGTAVLSFLLAWATSLIQAPGLARRDQQDRSIEFWVSLPAGHVQSVGATVLMNLILMPLMLLGLAVAGGLVAAMLAVLRVHGLAGWGALPWVTLLTVLLVGVPRLALGLVLGMLWLSPLLMLAMAASAWLKRWGVPVLAAVIGLGGLFLREAYDQPWLLDSVEALFTHFAWAVVPTGLGTMSGENGPWSDGRLSDIGAWIWKDTVMVLGDLASPLFAVALVVAAIGFGLVVLRRMKA
jgi:hypothetical protein